MDRQKRGRDGRAKGIAIGKSRRKQRYGKRNGSGKRDWRANTGSNTMSSSSNGSNENKRAKFRPRGADDTEQYKQIGSNLTFNDLSSEISYPFDTLVSPYLHHNYNQENPKGRIKSLKEYAAMKMAQNAQYITRKLLMSASWSIWEPVWRLIASSNADTFALYQMFASEFSQEPTFKSHHGIFYYPHSKKQVVISSIFPNSSNHRVERLYGNIRITHLIDTLNMHCHFKNLTILNISKPSVHDDYIHLTNLTNLTSLCIDRTNIVPDQVIYSWTSALKAKKWSKLQILSLPEISKDSFKKLQNVAQYCQLMYLEVQTKFPMDILKEWPDVDVKNWEIVNNLSLHSLSWGMKTLTILRKFAIENHTISPTKNTMCLDFNILDHPFSEKQSDFDHLWSMMPMQSYYQSLVLKKKLTPGSGGSSSTGSTGGTSGVRRPQAVKKKLGKPKGRITSDINAFFDI